MSQALPDHPGAILQNLYLGPANISPAQAAAAMNVPEQVLVELLAGRISVNLDLALRLAGAVGNTVEFWITLQCYYDIDRAAMTLSDADALRPLVPKYWGRPVAAFYQEIPWGSGKTAPCLVTCAFTAAGRPLFVLTQRDRYRTPSLTMCFEHHAFACINAVKSVPYGERVCFMDEKGFAYFRTRCQQARRDAIEAQEPNMHGVSAHGDINWVAHFLEGTSAMSGEQVDVVQFHHENTPSVVGHYSGENLLALLGRETCDLTWQHARD